MKFIYATRNDTGQLFCIPESDLTEYPDVFSEVIKEEKEVKDPIAHEVLKNTRSKKAKL